MTIYRHMNTSFKLPEVRDSEIDVKECDKKCAPNRKFENGSCIPLGALVAMAEAYNIDNPDNKIKLSSTPETLSPDKYKRYLLGQFKKHIPKCDTQVCWTRQAFNRHLNEKIKEELEKDTFRPSGPNGKFTWLNTINIDQVIEQYNSVYPEFHFLGAVPNDFDDLPGLGIKNLNFGQLVKEGKTKIGVVFNTDPHYKSGQHWISMYADLKKGECYYFDSYGVPPSKEVRKLMNRIAHYIESTGKKPIIDHNKVQHQKGNNACGVYSISFVLRMLRGDTFKELSTKRIPDGEINKCRDYYFSK